MRLVCDEILQPGSSILKIEKKNYTSKNLLVTTNILDVVSFSLQGYLHD